jgi:hypothetical protein
MTKNKNQLIDDLGKVWYTSPILDTQTVSRMEKIIRELVEGIGRTPEDYQL